jgi:hypothetical protein
MTINEDYLNLVNFMANKKNNLKFEKVIPNEIRYEKFQDFS